MHETGKKELDQAILSVEDVTYSYDGEALPVWKHLSCHFYKGKIHAICGPSGCGKSSILYLLDGLIPHLYEGELEGRVLYEGEDLTDLMPRDRCDRIGYVMQDPESQFCTFTVIEELAFGMENLGLPTDEMEVRIREALDLVGMSGYEREELTALSGGQKQKIAIAAILVTRPEVILMDEPTANLDPVSRQQIFELITHLSEVKGMTVILVEHNMEEMIAHVDHILALDHSGAVVAAGSLEEVSRQGWSPYDDLPVTEPAKDLSTDEVVLSIEDISFTYPGKEEAKPVLRDLSMEVRRQELLAIVGENGAGKTSLTRLIFRIFAPDRGEIRLLGRPVDRYRKRELYHKIGLVFQNPEHQFIKNTVDDELFFSLKRVKISQQEKQSRVDEMLQKFHLAPEREKSPFILSQGQKRRLSVAGMLLTQQEILFLDEPTFGQDNENRHELMKDLQELVADGITVVMITHDLSLVRRYATRVVEIKDGRVSRDLPTEQFFAQNEAGTDPVEGGEGECSPTSNEIPSCTAGIR